MIIQFEFVLYNFHYLECPTVWVLMSCHELSFMELTEQYPSQILFV